MRFVLVCLCFLLLSRPGIAEDDASGKLYGSWRLVSFQSQIVGEAGPAQDLFGSQPFGRLILTPDHYMAAYISRPERKPPSPGYSNAADAVALMSSMIAYTGKFRLEGDRFITAVDGAWNEILKANEQVRFFTVDGERLSIRTPEQPSGAMPGKRVVSVLLWQRER